jgi:transposase InsO family protein
VKENLTRDFFARYGHDMKIISDGGSNFVSAEMEAFLSRNQISRAVSTPYHHQANGAAEAMIKKIKRATKKLLLERPGTDWIDLLPEVLFAMRNTEVEAIGVSPNMMMFGFNTWRPEGIEVERRDRVEVRKRAEESDQLAKARAKRAYDRDVNVHVYKVGDLLMLKNHQVRKGAPKWRGPFQVIEVMGDGRDVRIAGTQWARLGRVKPLVSASNTKPHAASEASGSIDRDDNLELSGSNGNLDSVAASESQEGPNASEEQIEEGQATPEREHEAPSEAEGEQTSEVLPEEAPEAITEEVGAAGTGGLRIEKVRWTREKIPERKFLVGSEWVTEEVAIQLGLENEIVRVTEAEGKLLERKGLNTRSTDPRKGKVDDE